MRPNTFCAPDQKTITKTLAPLSPSLECAYVIATKTPARRETHHRYAGWSLQVGGVLSVAIPLLPVCCKHLLRSSTPIPLSNQHVMALHSAVAVLFPPSPAIGVAIGRENMPGHKVISRIVFALFRGLLFGHLDHARQVVCHSSSPNIEGCCRGWDVKTHTEQQECS